MKFESDDKINKTMFESRMRTLEQIEEMLAVVFADTDEMDLEAFSTTVETKCSDLLVNASLSPRLSLCSETVCRAHKPFGKT